MHAERLTALATLLRAGRSPVDALAALERAGSGRFATPVLQAVRGGLDLGSALARAGVLRAAEVQRAGGAAGVVDPATLAWLAGRRRLHQQRRRAAVAGLLVPGVLAGSTWLSALFASTLLHRSVMAMAIDMLPLVLIGVGVAVAGLLDPSIWRPVRRLPLIGRALRRDAEAAFMRALAESEALDAAAFARAGRLSPDAALTRAAERTARRLADGATLPEAVPPAAMVGERCALALLDAVHAADPAARLRAFADEGEVAATRAAATATRLLGWLAVLWISARMVAALLTVDISHLGFPVPGAEGNSRDLDELMRELNLP